MKVFDVLDLRLSNMIGAGAVGVLPTDTLYGLCCSAGLADSVRRVYVLKKRDQKKPLIILIGKAEDVMNFGCDFSGFVKDFCYKVWPGPISVVLPCQEEKLEYLHRGTWSLAFRVPNNLPLLKIISEVGPLVAPSANPEGHSCAVTVEEAMQYFGDGVDFYAGSGRLSGEPSGIVKIQGDKIIVVRKSSTPIPRVSFVR